MLLKAARVHAWLSGREHVQPEDLHAVFHEVVAHRLVFNPMYEARRTVLARELTARILRSVTVQ
jgi:MoxR-like ATPase